ncbi:MAG TPA: hypothetical protein ENK58_04130 [Desulfobacterales bacterium]|nr:hypothetical protein [Desulfobacterales bacterium]
MPNPAANHTKTGLIYFNTDPSVIRVIRGSCFTASPKSVIFTLAYIIKVIVERRLTAEVVRRRRAEKRVRELHHELLRSQENERHRIALDLHDSVIQELSAVPLEYEALFGYDKRMSHRAVAKSEELNDILRNLVRSLRSLVYGLRPLPWISSVWSLR